MACCSIRPPGDGIGGAAGASAICPLAAVLCILGPICLTDVSAGCTFGPVGLREWSSGRVLGDGELSGDAGACLGLELGATEDGNGSEDTAPVSGVAGV